jgi:glutaredoxin
VDVVTDEKNMEKMLKLSRGQRKVPVIVKGDDVTIGYGGT